MSFLEVAIEADVRILEDLESDPEFREIALRNCGEHWNTRQHVIQELRSMVIERGQCKPRRMDDEYLLKFLRCRRFIPALAHKLMVRYEHFRREHAVLYRCDLAKLKDENRLLSCTLPETPEYGRLIIFRFGFWDINKVSSDCLMQIALSFIEIASQHPRTQVLGATGIIDMEGLTFGHLRAFTPTLAHQLMSIFGVNLPIMNRGVHVINYNWLLTSFVFICRRFLPSGSLRLVHFHSDLSSLHKHIHPAHLPKSYGGHCRHELFSREWLAGVLKYIKEDEGSVRELKELGYTVGGKSDKF